VSPSRGWSGLSMRAFNDVSKRAGRRRCQRRRRPHVKCLANDFGHHIGIIRRSTSCETCWPVRKGQGEMVAAAIRAIFVQPTRPMVRAQVETIALML
jgi:hypothetical protein